MEDVTDEETESESEKEAFMAITEQIKELTNEMNEQNELKHSALARLSMLEKYGGTFGKQPPGDLEQSLNAYKEERSKAHADKREASAEHAKLNDKLMALSKERARLGKAAMKARMRLEADKEKEMAKKQRKQQEIRQEKARIKAERVMFWPKKVYRITISLDAPSGSTPASSRRSSTGDSSFVPPKETKSSGPASEISGPCEINLALSYITYSASWSPRYDLSLNTVTNSGILDYCADLKNSTSETWSDTKVILSTSQTSYQGLGDTIPVLQPWHVRLMKSGMHGKGGSGNSNQPALYSQYEQDEKTKNRGKVPPQAAYARRNELFGLPSSHSAAEGQQHSFSSMPQQPMMAQHAAMAQHAPMAQHPPMQMQQMTQQQQTQTQSNPYTQIGKPHASKEPAAFGVTSGTSIFNTTATPSSSGLFGMPSGAVSTNPFVHLAKVMLLIQLAGLAPALILAVVCSVGLIAILLPQIFLAIPQIPVVVHSVLPMAQLQVQAYLVTQSPLLAVVPYVWPCYKYH
jgi:type IV secretory pathway VirB10-like protein